jgi:hypothetical protein
LFKSIGQRFIDPNSAEENTEQEKQEEVEVKNSRGKSIRITDKKKDDDKKKKGCC